MGEVPPNADRKSVWLDCDPGTMYDYVSETDQPGPLGIQISELSCTCCRA